MLLTTGLLLCVPGVIASSQVILNQKQQQAIANCVAVAQDGRPLTAMPNGKGDWNCVECEGESYADEYGLVRCCSSGAKYSTDVLHPANGKCCPTDTSYTYDAVARKGDCCPSGQTFVGTACSVLGPLTSLSAPILITDGCTGCGNGPVCSANGHLGIQYGHCYTMVDTNGRQIQRDEGYLYRQSSPSNDNTAFVGLVFRVCNSTSDCTQKQDQYVPERGNWFQLDQNGWRDGTSPGWMIFTSTWLLSMGTIWNTAGYPLANFTGRGSCFFGKCAISLQFGVSDTSGLLGMASYGGAYLSRCQNSNSWKPYHYEEVSCNTEKNAWATL